MGCLDPLGSGLGCRRFQQRKRSIPAGAIVLRDELLERFRRGISRSEYLAALCIIGCANGAASKIIQVVARHGWIDSVLATFGISAIVWIAGILGIGLVLRDCGDRITAADIAAGVIFVFLVALPGSGASWLALTALCLYILLPWMPSSTRHRGAMILLTLTIPMLWSPLLFRCFSETILGIDAYLVSQVLGSPRTGNMVRFADGGGELVILPPCSSIANLSVVVVCWVTMSQMVAHRPTFRDLIWCSLAGASVVAINITRVSLMGLNEQSYQTVHSPMGDLIANVVMLCLLIGFCLLGLRREFLSRI
jgi:hypothetical protein